MSNMIIKNRQFKVEKMGQFLAQKEVQRTPSNHFSMTPVQNKHEYLQANLHSWTPQENSFMKHSSAHNPLIKSIDVYRSAEPKLQLPLIAELSQLRGHEKRQRNIEAKVVSRSTPKLEAKMINSQKGTPKKPVLFNQKHIDSEAPESSRVAIDYDKIKAFNKKYNLEFVTGYHNMNILQRCVDLLNQEHDPFILENIIPNKYTEYLVEVEKAYQGGLQSIEEIRGHAQKKPSRNSSNDPSFGLYLQNVPQIRRSYDRENSALKLKPRDSHSDRNAWGGNSTNSSNFSLNLSVPLPKLEFESFQKSLDYFKVTEQDGIFLFMKTGTKGVVSEFGFCEAVFGEKRKGAACITKIYIPRVYRKMKLVLPITFRMFEYLFRVLKLEKLSIKLLSGNTFVQKELRTLGFKLERVDYEGGKKYRYFTLKRNEFEEVLNNLYYLEDEADQ